MSTSTSTRAGDVPGSANGTRIVLRPSGDRCVGGGCLVALPIVILPTAIGSVVARGGRMSDLLALPILALIVMLMVGLAILPSHVIIDSSGFHRRGILLRKDLPWPVMPSRLVLRERTESSGRGRRRVLRVVLDPRSMMPQPWPPCSTTGPRTAPRMLAPDPETGFGSGRLDRRAGTGGRRARRRRTPGRDCVDNECGRDSG